MKKSQIACIIIAAVCSIIAAAYYFNLGYTNGSDDVVLDTVVGTVEKYKVHYGDAYVTLKGHKIVYKASSSGDYDRLGLQDNPLHVGETVEILFDRIRGNRYPIVGIATETWRVSIEDAYRKGWDRFQLFTYLLGTFLVLSGIASIALLVRVFKKNNQKLAEDGFTNSKPKTSDPRLMLHTSILREPSLKGRVLMRETCDGMDIVVKRAFGVTELIVDGMVYAEEKVFVEINYTLEAKIKNTLIKFELNGSSMRLYANGHLLKKSVRFI